MSSKPKKQDYKPPASQIALTKQAGKDFEKFDTLYNPALLDLKDQAGSDDIASILAGRANADTMGALTSGISYRATQDTDGVATNAGALSDQTGIARAKGLGARNDLAQNVLATRNKQSGVASQGLSSLARMETGTVLKDAENKKLKDDARMGMTSKLVFAAADFADKKGAFGKKDSKGSNAWNAFSDALKSQDRTG